MGGLKGGKGGGGGLGTLKVANEKSSNLLAMATRPTSAKQLVRRCKAKGQQSAFFVCQFEHYKCLADKIFTAT